MLEIARNRIGHHGLRNVELCEGDVARLPISDESVDLTTAVLVLHHVALPREAIGELYRVLRKGGQVLMVEQATHHNEAFHDRMQDRWWGFDAKEFAGWLRDAGFDDIRANSLITTERAVDAPDLFVITGRKNR
jgi:SAM-dependent methyltransferase